MANVFKEQIVKRRPAMKDNLMRAGIIIAAAVISFLSVANIPGFGALLAMASLFGAWYLMSFLKVEYEYAFTDGELDIDIIFNQARRKRVFNIRVNDIEIMAHVDDKMHMGEFGGAQETRDYSSGARADNTYAFLVNHQGKRTKVIVEPNEVMLKAIATVLTRRRLHVKV